MDSGEVAEHGGVRPQFRPIEHVALDVEDGVKATRESQRQKNPLIDGGGEPCCAENKDGPEGKSEPEAEWTADVGESQAYYQEPHGTRNPAAVDALHLAGGNQEPPPSQASQIPRRQRQKGVPSGAVAGAALIGVQHDSIDRAAGGDRDHRVADLVEEDDKNLERVHGRRIPQKPNGAEVRGEPDQEHDLIFGMCRHCMLLRLDRSECFPLDPCTVYL